MLIFVQSSEVRPGCSPAAQAHGVLWVSILEVSFGMAGKGSSWAMTGLQNSSCTSSLSSEITSFWLLGCLTMVVFNLRRGGDPGRNLSQFLSKGLSWLHCTNLKGVDSANYHIYIVLGVGKDVNRRAGLWHPN